MNIKISLVTSLLASSFSCATLVLISSTVSAVRAQEVAGEATVPDTRPAPHSSKLNGPSIIAPGVAALALEGEDKGAAKRSISTVEGPGFTGAVHVRLEILPSNEARVKLVAATTEAIEEGDVLAVRFWMRGVALRAPVAGRPHVNVALEDATGKIAGEAFRGTVPGLSTWREFRVGIRAQRALAAGDARLSLRLGVVPQEVEIGNVSLVNLKKSVAFDSLRSFRNFNRGDNDKPAFYSAQDRKPDAPWRIAAQERIEKHRKGDLQVLVTREGKPVEGARVQVKMLRHAFPFSTAVGSEMILGKGADADKYREILLSWFNSAAPENDLKWHKWNRAATHQSLAWLRERDYKVHGHTLMWGHWGYPQGPEKALVAALPKDSPQVHKIIVDHIRRVTKAHRGRVEAWDVLNEPYTQNVVMGALGDGAMVEWFRAAREGDPNARLFLNEFNILEDTNKGQVDALEKTLKYLRDAGAPLDGIGLQSHIGTPVSPPRIIEILDRFAQFKLPIAITEFDNSEPNEALQGEFMRDFITAAFSHPWVESINNWGFWEKKHWIPQAALFRADWTMKPNGAAFYDLVHKQWKTDLEGASDKAGKYLGRGFLGDYEISATQNGHSKSVRATLLKEGATVRVELP